MKIEREIISRENIKPSSPTPPNLKTHKISLLDQIIPPCFFPLVLYFPAPGNLLPKNADEFISQTTQNLKRTLSSTLTLFYPLAGRIKDSLSIDCNDDGALFVVSKIKGNLSDFLKKPDKTESSLLLPIELKWTEEPAPGTHILMIQVNYFDCGGSAIGSLFWHRATDGVTICTFLKTWAAISRGNFDQETTGFPVYTAGTVFPQHEAMEKESSLFFIPTKYLKIGKPSMRRYVFDSSAISTLRTKLTAPDHHQGQGLEFRPSRVEIVSSLIWKCFMTASSKNKSSRVTKSLAAHSVNIRRKTNPPFPEHTFGNFVWLAPTSSIDKIHDVDMKHLIRTLRGAINRLDGGFLRRMQQGSTDDESESVFSGYCKNVEETWNASPDKAEYLSFSSWCNFGIYNVTDFGWGKPVWITGSNGESGIEYPFLNLVWLMDTREGGGIEAWVCLDEQYFEAFEKNQDLQAHASFDPSPFRLNGTSLLI